jgi:hypothetical protein
VPLRDPIKFIVECGVGDDVDSVIVNGAVRMSSGAIHGLDTAALMARTQRLAEATWEALPDWDPLGRRAEEMGPFSFPVAER